MQRKSRLENSIINSSVSTIIFILNIFIKFILQGVFIHYLGAEYLGLKGLFTNILSMLSLADLGIGTAIVFSLYKPLQLNDIPQIKALVYLYKKIYNFIGIFVCLLGLTIIPFLPLILGKNINIPNIYLIYLLFLMNSVFSYFLAYNRSLLNADQNGYLNILNNFIYLIIVTIGQILILALTGNYILFLIIQVVCTIASNIDISFRVKKRYKDVFDYPETIKLNNKTITTLKKNTIGNLSNKIGTVVVMGSDNILISLFVNLTAVGIYSNYTLIINSIGGIFNQLTGSITASIGNVAVTDDEKTSVSIFFKHYFINFTLLYFSTISMILMIQPFINIWVGKFYLLDNITFALIILNFVITMFRNTSLVFIDAYGLAWIQRWKPIIESILNIVLSLVFLVIFNMGIKGVLLGTILSSLTFISWYEPYIVLRYGVKEKFSAYIKVTVKYSLSLSLGILSIMPLIYLINADSIFGMTLRGIIGFIISLFIYFIFYLKTNEFQFILYVVKQLKMRLKKQKVEN